MRLRVAVSVLSGFVLVVAIAVVVTAVRSDAKDAGAASSPTAVSLARAPAAGSDVTVPALDGGTAAATPLANPSTDPESGGGQAAAAALASAAASRSSAAERLADQAARSSAAVSRALAARKAAAASAAASSAAAASAAAASAAAASAAASRVAASIAAVSSSEVAAASSSAAASSAAAATSAAAESASAAANPAPDTSDAVEEAVEEAAASSITQSVVVMNRQTGSVTTSFDSNAQVPAMSLFKIIVAADVIDQAGGVENVDPDTLAQLHEMIIASDDSIAQDFYDADGQGDIVTRVADKYGLTETMPSPEPRYWGDVRITAHDMGSLLYQLLAGPDTGLWFAQTMKESLDTGADGFDQDFGVNSIPDAGSKQGWGCCLADVLAIHSMGFTANQIIVVLSTAPHDVPYTELGTASELRKDPGAQASVASVTRTVEAALPLS